MKKRHQHTVWQHYLKSWTTADGAIFCMSKGRIFSTGTPVIAVEKDFYRLHNVTLDDITLILWLASENSHPLNQKLHRQFLTGMSAPIILFGHLAKHDKGIEEALDTFLTNALEEFYAGIEGRFIPLLARIRAGDASFYSDDKDALEFVYFVCTQYMRTKAIRVRTIERLKNNGLVDLTHVWNLLSYMFAVNIGSSLYLERKNRKLVLIENRTETPFITGDQPVTNLLGTGQTEPNGLVLYYPIAPTLALILSEVGEEPPFASEHLNPETVTQLNARILAVSHGQIFGASRPPLEQLIVRTHAHEM